MNDITRTADVIAAEINGIKAQTRAVMLCGSIEIGRRLVEAKAVVNHGEWIEWLEKSVDYSPRTAQNLMKIFDEYGANQIPLFGDNAKTQALADLSYTQAVALLGIPAGEREAFMEENDVASMSTRELQQAIRERDEALAKVKTVEKDAEEADKARETLSVTLDKTKVALKNATGEIDKLKTDHQRTTKEVARLTTELAAARAAGADTSKIDEITGQLNEAQEQVRQLTEQLAQPVTVEAKIQPDPAAVAVMKFGIQFDALVVNFRNLLGALGEIKTADVATGEKYSAATARLIDSMREKVI